MISIDDLEIFILTYNRSSFLTRALDSFLNQVAGLPLITVMDNCSTDDTEIVVKSFQEKSSNIRYYKHSKNVGGIGNLERARLLANKKYVCFFHDDDVAHPQFLQVVLELLNKHDNVDLICTTSTTFTSEEQIIFSDIFSVDYCFFSNKKIFTEYVYSSPFFITIPSKSLCYPNVIYKTENIRKSQINYDIGGKSCDGPIVISSLRNGSCIQIRNDNIFFYRLHSGQDSVSKRNDPNVRQIINYMKFFKKKLSCDLKSRVIFGLYSYKWLKKFYYYGNNPNTKDCWEDFVRVCKGESLIHFYDWIPFSYIVKIIFRIFFENFFISPQKLEIKLSSRFLIHTNKLDK
ncbi:MAG: glycosyltransferase [Pseudobutyrivibrio ruminis]|nr:glycosyltransferase [Pseudobutyrivibrio ruminis]